MKKIFVLLILTNCFLSAQNAWINEFHYNDAGGPDVGEFVEIAIENAGSYVLNDFTVNLYNGGTGLIYDTETLNNFIVGNTINNVTYYYWEPSSGIQNGSPDGFSLDYQLGLIQFLSYQGTFTATEGVANGFSSTDIGVEENTAAAGESLQLQGTGSQYSDFTWSVNPIANTKGNINSGQTTNIPDQVLVDVKVLLEGPYNNSYMNANLAIPFESPYSADPVNVNPIPSIPGNEIVDWVLLELRHETTKAIIESQSAFILQNGKIVDIDGSSPVYFSSPSGNYFIAVKHRNHLSVMSATAVSL